ncbi:MAG TPA: molybdenum cofactor biosynthesis protein MoaE [Candidatus Dormibacteraeota bacterium]|jgi:molybdopterin synthase catalytic subunit|nr:molybdenum cofactor biosynthesis protein MoaE [Candidatus Dormibacteraeota bacterium]
MSLTVTVRLFARLRELAGTGQLRVDLEPGSTLVDLYGIIRSRFPGIPAAADIVRPTINREFAGWDSVPAEGDEVSFIPPVSGGREGPLIELTTEPLDPARLEQAVNNPAAGATCTFVGHVRDNSNGVLTAYLEYEAYQEMAVTEMGRLAAEVLSRWPDARIAIAHRLGRMEIGEASVVISIATPHRAEAFAACQWTIDHLKESVPIWKKEFSADGASWIEGPPHLHSAKTVHR